MKTSLFNQRILLIIAMFTAILWLSAGAVQAELVPDAGSIVLYHLDGDATDSSGNGYNGIEINVTYETGLYGQAIRSTATNGINIPKHADLQPGDTSFTIEAWIKPEAVQLSNAHAYIIAGGWGSGRLASLSIFDGKYLSAIFGADEQHTVGQQSADVSAILNDGNWHHVMGVLDREDGDKVKVYLDGVDISTADKTLTEPIWGTDGKFGFIIGHLAPWYLNSGAEKGFAGLIDDVRISNVARNHVFAVETKLYADDLNRFAEFGYSVDVNEDGTAVVVGARHAEVNGFAQAGAVYVYKLNETVWEETKIIASDSSLTLRFGTSVAVSNDGETIVVGTPNGNGLSVGSAYILKFNGVSWDETKISGSDTTFKEQFGISVDISGDGEKIIVGAKHAKGTRVDDGQGGYYYLRTGAAYLFNNRGENIAKLVPSDGDHWDLFGISVAISKDGTNVIVGASDDQDNGPSSGSAYIYSTDIGFPFHESVKLTPSDGESHDKFGGDVSINNNGSVIAIGAEYNGDNTLVEGAVYVYDLNGRTWNETKLVASDRDLIHRLGHAISISDDGNRVVATSIDNVLPGAAYVFDNNGVNWLETKLTSSYNHLEFGTSVAVNSDGYTVVVGAPDTVNENSIRSGAAFIFE